MNALVELGKQTILNEAVYLDERNWDDWLALYTTDCVYWVPTWLTQETLSTDPQRELAHIYYASRAGLEDRVLRIRSRQSPASTSMRRTTHMVGNIFARAADESAMQLRSSWTCHVFDPHQKKTFVMFGSAEYQLRPEQGMWKIARKKTILQNDYLPSMVDVYCI